MKKILPLLLVLLLIVGAIFYLEKEPEPQVSPETLEEMSGEYSGAILAGSSSLLIDFNPEDYEEALQTNKLIVLYFYANWCPICRDELPNALYPAFNELTADTVIGFRVNFNDNETDQKEEELAREFGVAYQHTKVFLLNGEKILKDPESWDKETYLSEIQNALTKAQ